MNFWIIAGLIGTLAVLLVLRARKPVEVSRDPLPAAALSRTGAALPSKSRGKDQNKDTFRGAMVVAQVDACPGVLRLRGRTFPESEAPTLPLGSCGRETCGCKINPVVGRRLNDRRLSSDRRDAVRFGGERRIRTDRRKGRGSWTGNSA